MLLEPEPHIPDIPEVSSTAEDPVVTGISDVTGDVDVPDVAVMPDIAAVPEFPAVAGGAVPAAIPPPSKLAADPNIWEGEVAAVEHAVPVLVVGIVIVPVMPVGTGLTPSDMSSVESSGIPAAPIPSGEVAPSEGIVACGSVSASSTWANAGLQHHKGRATAAIKNDLMEQSPI